MSVLPFPFDASKVKPRLARSAELNDINARAKLVLPALVEILAPGGQHRSGEYYIRNPRRDDRNIGSFSINTENGFWNDRAVAEGKGRDVIGWTAYVKDICEANAVAIIKSIIDSGSLCERVANLELRRDWKPVVPIPVEVGPPGDNVVRSLTPPGYIATTAYPYDDNQGQTHFYVMRYERYVNGKVEPGRKKIRPLCWAENLTDGRCEWKAIAARRPRIMYRLPDLTSRVDVPILIVEGEKTADIAAERFADYCTVTSCGGAGAAHLTDWSPLRGRVVVVWPDNDVPGQQYGKDTERLARIAGAASVRIVKLPCGLPNGFDLADPAPKGVDLRELLDGAQEGAASAAFTSKDWASPDFSLLREEDVPAKPFPIDLLGDFWSSWALSKARSAAAPVDYTAAALLGAVGALLANVRWPTVNAQGGWAEPVCLWCAIVGRTGEMKTPALRPIWKLLQHAEQLMGVDHDATVREYEKRKIAAEQAREKWDQAVRAAADAGEAEPDMPREAYSPEEPVKPRLVTNDPTVERLAELASQHPRGFELSRDELTAWLAASDRSYGGKDAERAFWLEAYNGDPFTLDRVKNRAGLNVAHLSVGVLGGIQPDKLKAITAGPQDGLSTRFLYSWPSVYPDLKFAREALDDEPAHAAIARLIHLSMDADFGGRPTPRRIALSPDAEDALEVFAQDLQHRARRSHGHLAGALNKARGHVLRLSAILEYLWWSAGALQHEPFEVSLEAVSAAFRLMDGYFLPMAERVFGEASRADAERYATLVARYLKLHRPPVFNARKVRKAIGGEYKDNAKLMDEACEVLVDAGLIRFVGGRQGDTVGNQRKDYEVNPLLWSADP